MTYDEALAIVEEARRGLSETQDHFERWNWDITNAENLLFAAETLQARARGCDTMRDGLREVLAKPRAAPYEGKPRGGGYAVTTHVEIRLEISRFHVLKKLVEQESD